MAKKSLEPITEPMYYVLLSFRSQPMCGKDVASYVRGLTADRVSLGPGTLYSILSTFQEEGLIEKLESSGRKIPYRITERGMEILNKEIERMRVCLADAEEQL